MEIEADSLKKAYTAGEEITYSLTVKNSFAGHKVPTGDPERFFLITFKVLDANDTIMDKKQFRIGEEWEWYPTAKKLSDNNLNPLEEREYNFVYKVPDKDNLTLVVEISKHRMTKENAKYLGILGEYPLSISVFRQSYPINLKEI